MRKVLFLALIALFAVGAVQAIYTQETRYAVEQTDIVQRDILFNQNKLGFEYVKPVGGFGMKGASRGSLGSKGEEDDFSNLATNAFIKMGRTPGHISNYYWSARGYHIIDEAVELKPVDNGLTVRPQITAYATGMARIVSKYSHELRLPEGAVFLRTRDLPPLQNEEVYEAWLVDEDTGYSQSMGVFNPKNIGRTASVTWKIQGLVIAFDTIIVTKEPYPDTDPSPGAPILIGDIKPKIVVK